ncbi:MAG: Protein translocase subunit SecE [Parcubacteria group bacterium]|nr:Protein translocase subunit SecE [Parcubacteria group bacterium]
MKSFITYLKNVRGELTHVVWPNRKMAILHTVLIILISALVAVIIGLFDYAFTSLAAKFLTGA